MPPFCCTSLRAYSVSVSTSRTFWMRRSTAARPSTVPRFTSIGKSVTVRTNSCDRPTEDARRKVPPSIR